MKILSHRSDLSRGFRAEHSLYRSLVNYSFLSGRSGLSAVLLLMLVALLLPMTAKSARGDTCNVAINGSDSGWESLYNAINGTTDCIDNSAIYITLKTPVTSSSGQNALIIPEDREVTIELNGYTIDRKMIGGPVFEVKGALIIGDSTGKGMITGGNADQGGGVYVADGGKFEMSGGTITGNKAAAGGSGVYVAAGGKFTLSGSPDIYGNISDNIYLCDGTKIEIESELNNTEPIGITMAVPGVFAEDNDPDHNNAGKFISDNPVYKVSYYDDGGKGYFKLESVDQYSIAAGVSPENSGTVIGGGTYFENTSAKVTAVPSTGYQFVNWTEAGKEVSTDAEYTFTVTKARNLVANFKPNNYTITAGVSPENSGTVTGAGTYDYGRSATLTATPAAGYRFVNWTEGGKEVSIDADYIFTVSGPRALTANFVKTHEISVEADPAAGGTVTGGDTYSENTSVTVTATPSSGYRFVKWTEGGSQVSNEAAYTFTVSGARSLTAHFEKIPAGTYSVTVIKEGQGSASASPDHGPAGSKVTLSAEPAEGYRFKEWQVVSGGVTIADDGTFTIGTENVSVKAVFQGYTYNGEGEDHLIASGEDAVFTIKRSINDELSFDKFKGIRMDGADVAPENYTAVRGSVVITLKAAYMDTLGPGQHTLTAVFEDGEAPVPFNVTESAAFEVPVDIVFVKNDSTRGVPFDVKAETLKPVLTIKDGEKVLSASKALKVEIEPGASDPDPSPTAYFSKEVKLEPGKYTVSVSGLPETIGLEIPDGDAKDAPKYSLTAKAEINLKDGKPVITLYLIFTPPALKIEEPVVYPLLEDEIGAYWLRKDGTKEYLLFHTYDICMSWLGKDELCRGYERCFHKDGK